LDQDEFRKYAHELVDWMVDYLADVESHPVKPDVNPGDIIRTLPQLPPPDGESFDTIFGDFKRLILPGMTHWQHPSFFAYFPANSSPPSILAEMLTATMGAQCMSWATSPAATELEERMMQWLGQMIGLPGNFTGVIQDTASTATLVSILTAREVRSNFSTNEQGYTSGERFTAYCSRETHSSFEKGLKIAGIGRKNLRKIDVDENFALKPALLEKAVTEDIRNGYAPFCVIAAIGTTGSTAIDPLAEIADICGRYNIWLHVDAAFAGTALLLPEMRWMIDGIERADSFVFNPHKWMFTNFDCSAYFVRDVEALVRTFEILPEYLKTPEGNRVNNYRDWGIQLGRRFRALKLWFVIRSFGVLGLQEKIRTHIRLAQDLATAIKGLQDFELLAPVPLNTVCFRYRPHHIHDTERLNRINAALLESLNKTGRLYLTHTKLNEIFTLRMVIGQTAVRQDHVDRAWQLIESTARALSVTSL
jgi:aromatic-L-amino-acid decarboxylase